MLFCRCAAAVAMLFLALAWGTAEGDETPRYPKPREGRPDGERSGLTGPPRPPCRARGAANRTSLPRNRSSNESGPGHFGADSGNSWGHHPDNRSETGRLGNSTHPHPHRGAPEDGANETDRSPEREEMECPAPTGSNAGSRGAGGASPGSGSEGGSNYFLYRGEEVANGPSDRLSRTGVILVAVGGALLGVGLTAVGIAVFVCKRSAARVQAMPQQVIDVGPFGVTGVGKPKPLPDVVVMEAVEMNATPADALDVCVGTVVPTEGPFKLF